MGVFIGQSTKIYDRATGEVIYGRVPSGSVVVPGSLPSRRRQVLARLRRHRQARGRADARQDVHQRAAARVSDIQHDTLQLARQLSRAARSRPPMAEPRPARGASVARGLSRASGSIAAR